MLGLKKQVSERKGRIRTFAYDGFSVSGGDDPKTLYASVSRNCDCRNGVLTTGVGAKQYLMRDGNDPDLLTSNEVRTLYPIKRLAEDGGSWEESIGYVAGNGMLGFYSTDYAAYRFRLSVGKKVTSMRITSPDLTGTTLFVGEKILVSCDIDGTLRGSSLYDGLAGIGCVCKNRVFIGLKPYTIAYSNPKQLFDFTETTHECGRIYLPAEKGNMIGLLTFCDTVYVFFERGIMRLEVGGSPYEFTAVSLAYGGGAIYPYSMGVCGNCVMFLATDGIYRFDGENAERVECLSVQPSDSSEQWCCHASCEGTYLLRYLDKEGDFRVAVVYEDGKSGYFSDVFGAVHEGDGRAFCQYGWKIGTVAKDGDLYGDSVYRFDTAETDFGVRGRKTLRSLRFEGDGEISVTVKSGGTEWTKRLTFADGAEWKVRARGEGFRFFIRLEKGAQVRALEAEIEY